MSADTPIAKYHFEPLVLRGRLCDQGRHGLLIFAEKPAAIRKGCGPFGRECISAVEVPRSIQAQRACDDPWHPSWLPLPHVTARRLALDRIGRRGARFVIERKMS